MKTWNCITPSKSLYIITIRKKKIWIEKFKDVPNCFKAIIHLIHKNNFGNLGKYSLILDKAAYTDI